jgi:hypothetical protein
MNPLGTILSSGSKNGTSGVYSLFTKGGFSKALSNLKGASWETGRVERIRQQLPGPARRATRIDPMTALHFE